MDSNTNKIAEYHANKRDLEHNKLIESKISIVKNDLDIATAYLEDIQTLAKQKHTERALARTTIAQIEESIENANDVENKLKAYEYYLEAIKRDGVPYELISEVLPLIQDEVNEILAQLVEFTIVFETDGKNILTFIKYDKSSWPLELTSGMEKFISSLAIRVALINVSNLPRPNFLAIDEGFGTLDSENLNSMFMLFDYLKSEFSFILVISHLDALRDVADNLFEINVTNDFSEITF
jgi:DNA repair exonuclease SbcCD ATPase subunit